MKNEKDVKAKVKKLLDKYGWFWWMPPANAYGKSGISDFHAFKAGVFMAIETKFGSNKPTANQIGFLNSIRAESGFAFVVNDSNIIHLEHFLESYEIGVQAAMQQKSAPAEHGSRMINSLKVLGDLIPLTT